MPPDLGVFWTFSKSNVQSVAMKHGKGVRTSIEDMPSFKDVMQISDLRVEAFSLMMVRVTDSAIAMSKNEVQAIIEAVTGKPLKYYELQKLPGTEEPSFLSRSSRIRLRPEKLCCMRREHECLA